MNDSTVIIDALMAMPAWEITAALLGIFYIILAAKESKWCWPFAFANTLIYTLLFWEGQLPMQALLNLYYMGMAIYGYILWRKHVDNESDVLITRWSYSKQLLFLLVGTILSLVTAYFLEKTATSQSPYLDASVTIFSIMNTWLLARKILQNWMYWIIIDSAAIMLYIQTEYYATAALFVLYTILALVGSINWQKRFNQQKS